jgi:GH43 family beta-xylosidase
MKHLQIALFVLLQSLPVLRPGILLAQNNPVIERVADAGVINFNGKYYLAGVFTNGGFYISNNLVKWEGPVHVFSMNNDWTKGRSAGDDQIHAADIHYWNGKFHFYWSVNHWGLRDMVVHIGHAVSDDILGPYIEPIKKSWFDDRIDAELFIDDDSSYYFYTVKFTDGNTIWGQQMSDPWTLRGEPKLLYTSLPGTWERYDNNVIEGPWVIKYRSKYFMMYNANHTSNRWGNYALGVAESDSPLEFNSGNKYPQPVVQSNLQDNPDEFRYYFTSSEEIFKDWRFVTDKPSDDWIKSEFNDSGWKSGEKGFGNQLVAGSSIIKRQSVWDSGDIWVRKKFTLTPSPSGNIQLLVYHAGPTEIYIDGTMVYSETNTNYSTIPLKAEVIEQLKRGNNLISMHSKGGRRSSHLDVELVDPINKQGDDILFNPGQPNIVRGPNGFEWWLVYFGIKNGGTRGQFINRVIFQDHELTVDGPTGIKTQGYHPDPSMPVFGDLFDHNDANELIKKWNLKPGNWKVLENELRQTDSIKKEVAFIKAQSVSNYLFKTGLKIDAFNKGKAGVVGYYNDPENILETGFSLADGGWYARLVRNGKEEYYSNDLSKEFNYNVYHSITILKNDKQFEILIDDNPAPGKNIFSTTFTGKGIPGLFTENCKASFDGVIFTPGWDEYNHSISGWGDSQNGDRMEGQWTVSQKGISQLSGIGNFSAFKGDLLDEYEFNTQIYLNLGENPNINNGTSGVYPVYIDNKNYLRVMIDYYAGTLIISGEKNNKEIAGSVIPLLRKLCKYPDPKYGDGFSKVYSLKKNTELSACEIVKSVYRINDFKCNLFDSLKIFYRQSGNWYPLDFRIKKGTTEAVDRIEFEKITADALKLISSAVNNTVPVYKLFITEEKTSDYNLRAVKLNDRVILFLDGKQVAEIKESWPASQVGLNCTDMAVRYNSITLFEK